MHLAHILRLRNLASHRAQVAVQGAAEELEQHLEADAGESRVVSSPRLVGDPLVSIPWFVRSRPLHSLQLSHQPLAPFRRLSRLRVCAYSLFVLLFLVPNLLSHLCMIIM